MPDLSSAVEEFLAEGVWEVKEMLRNNNGLTIRDIATADILVPQLQIFRYSSTTTATLGEHGYK